MKIIVSEEIKNVCPCFVGAFVEAKVKNSNYNSDLWESILSLCEKIKIKHTIDSIKMIPSIDATRKVYRACGKDPSRYRPAAEALIRRIINRKDLYRIDTLVDLINMSSIVYGYSIGGFDRDKIDGNTITLGIGEADELYEGIGRGYINIDGLPVYRDKIGGVGTPTSDNERTKITIDTTNILVIINGYDGNLETVKANAKYIQNLLIKYAFSDGGTVSFF